MFDSNTTWEKKMTNRYAVLPNPSSVGAAVTFLASAWFLAATGAMLTDSHSERLVEEARNQAMAWHATENVVVFDKIQVRADAPTRS